MAAPSDMESLRSAWRALAGSGESSGWQTIPVSVHAPCILLAGRRMPGGEEAVLIGFSTIKKIPDSHLPQGQGFEVVRLRNDPTGGGHLVLALARRTEASPELFSMMAEDLVRLLETCGASEEEGVLQRFLARIRAWQEFMDRHNEGMLSAEAEQGLFGELFFLDTLIQSGVPARTILDAWQGPLDGLHDFSFGTGGIEVKTTLSANGFPATVSSLEQLDDSLRQPLFLAAVRLSLDPSGKTLPGMAETVRERLCENREGLNIFEIRLMQAGFLPNTTEQYSRRFLHSPAIIFSVRGSFPRLTRGNVHPAITNARYEIDLELTGTDDVGLDLALELLGVA